MKEKHIILEILNENPNIGRDKFDRLYYSKVNYDINWVTILKELRNDKMVDEKRLMLTQKGIDYLNDKL